MPAGEIPALRVLGAQWPVRRGQETVIVTNELTSLAACTWHDSSFCLVALNKILF
jgi:hypothetical protein